MGVPGPVVAAGLYCVPSISPLRNYGHSRSISSVMPMPRWFINLQLARIKTVIPSVPCPAPPTPPGLLDGAGTAAASSRFPLYASCPPVLGASKLSQVRGCRIKAGTRRRQPRRVPRSCALSLNSSGLDVASADQSQPRPTHRQTRPATTGPTLPGLAAAGPFRSCTQS